MDEGFTLAGRHFTDPQLFRREIERIFFSMWVHAGRRDEIPHPGRYVTREIGGESFIILNGGIREQETSRGQPPSFAGPKRAANFGKPRRSAERGGGGSGIRDQEQNRDQGSGIRDQEQNEGGIRAFYNVCRHRGTRLCTDEAGELPRAIKCPYHAWTYDFTGRLIAASLMPEGFNKDDYPLHAVRTATWDGHIFVNLSESPAPLTDQLADLPAKFAPWRMEELRQSHRITYEVAANWKLIILNFNECLHCPVIHPILNRLTNYLGADNEQPKPTYIGGTMGFKPGVETMSVDGRRRRSYLPGLGPRERELVAYYVVYPNLLLSLHPDYMLTHAIWPLAPERTRIVCEWHFHPDQIAAPEFDPSDVVEFWDTNNREDWAITERSQLGIRSRANTPGPYSTREALLHAFDEWVLGKIRDD